jgi:hypothetical protein
MRFDWENFFRSNRIEYRAGSSREIVIKCPWCGGNDPSHHLSVNLDGKGFRCFRSEGHRGRSPARLIQILLRCSMDHARTLCGMVTTTPVGGDLLSQVKLLFQDPTSKPAQFPRLPAEFRPLQDKPSAWPYLSYMKSRGYKFRDILQLAGLFDLHYCNEGPFRARVIFPVKRHGKLINWTGRAIGRDTIPRYRSHTTQPELAEALGLDPAAAPISDLLLWHDLLECCNCGTLVICEGPFDALKVNHFGLGRGVIATCLFTMRASPAQIAALRELIYGRFKRAVLLLDRDGTFENAIGLKLNIPELEIVFLPGAIKDPGEFETANQMLRTIKR